MAAIEANGLTMYYGETRGIEDLTFAVREGEIFGVLGPDGAGKTTIVRTLMGFRSPTRGKATVLDHDITSGRDIKEMKHSVGYIPSDPVFEKGITGRQLLAYHASLKDDDRSEQLIDLFDVPVDRPISEYSRGNRQKLAITLAFMHDPALVIMDEPTSGLDPLARERFYEFIAAEKERGTTVFLSSQILSEACNVCDRIGILRNGHLVALEDRETLLDRAGKSVRVQIAEQVDVDDFAFEGVHDIEIVDWEKTDRRTDQSGSHPTAAVQADGGDKGGKTETETTQHGTTVQFIYTGEYDALFEQLLDYTVLDMNLTEAPLEAVFTRLYGARLGASGTDGGENNA